MQGELLEGRRMTTGLSLPANLMQATRARAKQEMRPLSWVIRRALVRYLAEECSDNDRQTSGGQSVGELNGSGGME